MLPEPIKPILIIHSIFADGTIAFKDPGRPLNHPEEFLASYVELDNNERVLLAGKHQLVFCNIIDDLCQYLDGPPDQIKQWADHLKTSYTPSQVSPAWWDYVVSKMEKASEGDKSRIYTVVNARSQAVVIALSARDHADISLAEELTDSACRKILPHWRQSL